MTIGTMATLAAITGGGRILLLVGAAIAGLAFGVILNTFFMGRKRRK